ncbi:MAG: GspH/FimT family pseudopilin [Alphaproteobacteria bacterium]
MTVLGWSRPVGRSQAGFTLLELLVVLAMLALVYAVAIPTRPAAWRGGDVAGAARTLAQDLRAARATAIAQRREVAVAVDPVALTYRVDRIETALPARDVETLTVSLAPGERTVRFLPDGSASGASLTLRHGDAATTVNVDWLTGRVEVAR